MFAAAWHRDGCAHFQSSRPKLRCCRLLDALSAILCTSHPHLTNTPAPAHLTTCPPAVVVPAAGRSCRGGAGHERLSSCSLCTCPPPYTSAGSGAGLDASLLRVATLCLPLVCSNIITRTNTVPPAALAAGFSSTLFFACARPLRACVHAFCWAGRFSTASPRPCPCAPCF